MGLPGTHLLAPITLGLLLLAPGAGAQVPDGGPAAAGIASAGEPAAAPVRASRLIGRDIENGQGWQIGRVDDLIVDPRDGRLAFVVLTAGSRFEVGKDALALPMPDERLTFDGKRLTWQEDLETLRRLSWIRALMEDEDEEVRERLTSARKLIGAPLQDGDGQRVGQVKDLVVDVAEGTVRFVADHDASWFRAGRMVALDQLRLVRGGEEGARPSVSVEARTLESRPPFDDPRFPRISESGWPQRLERLVSLD